MQVAAQALKQLVYMSAPTTMATYFRSPVRHGGVRHRVRQEFHILEQNSTTRSQQREVGTRLACRTREQDGAETMWLTMAVPQCLGL